MGFSGLFLAAFLSILLTQSNLCAAQTFVYNICSGGNFTANSTFHDNLGNLLSSISNTSFYEASVGREPDTVYGLFQCRGDYSPQDCKSCATIAAKDIRDKCPYSKESIVWYDECLLQYSNKSFATTVQFYPSLCLYNENNISNPNVFRPKRSELMNRLVNQAVNSSKLFAIGRDNFGINQTLYGLVQCTQEISKTDCQRCLTRAVNELPGCSDLQIGGRTIKPSCNVRYETYDFIQNKTALETPAPAAPFPRTGPPTNKNTTGKDEDSSKKIIVIIVPIVIAVIILFVVAIFFCLRRKKGLQIVKGEKVVVLNSVQPLQLDFPTVGVATGNFCDANKLGEGGFGAVYKGTLPDGREIAVKRLARNSTQGVDEFKNEVVLLSKLEHRNLVKLLGFCLDGDERVLIYEFLPNATLDRYLFDAVKVISLDWETRYRIIQGIARGLRYLHEDSQLMIIHRDIKASNILLDEKMNPKISDFGMARLFTVDQTHGSTDRIVGTFGYMAPEYACFGNFSVKSDVFSFGVLVLEIISGQKNTRYHGSQCDGYLLGNAWKHLLRGTSLELVEPSLGENYSPTEVIRCIHVGLLCVQDDVAKRPTITSVIVMLNRNIVTLPLPSAPAFFNNSAAEIDMISGEHGTKKTYSLETRLPDQSTASSTHRSVNEMSITELYPR